MSKRLLITTPVPEIADLENNRLFLGEWCLPYSSRSVPPADECLVLPCLWNDRQKLYREYQEVSALYEDTLARLARRLNQIHGVEHSVRYWRILVGPWLGTFMLALFDRWSSIKQAVGFADLAGCAVLSLDEGSLVPNDMGGFNALFPGDEWNHMIYGMILQYSFPFIPIRLLPAGSAKIERPVVARQGLKSILKRVLAHVSVPYARASARPGDAMLFATYLPRAEEIKLAARLGQFPQYFRSPSVPIAPVDFSRRQWILDGSPVSEFDACLRRVLPRQIPRAYIEGYDRLVKSTRGRGWPARPRVIWTSNAFHSDDAFKAWAADKVDQGSPLLIAQHGGNYGIGLWNWSETHELAICDRYLTWGWSDQNDRKVQPGVKLKSSRPRTRRNSNGTALLVTTMLQRYGNSTLPMPIASQWLDYLGEQFRFVEALAVEVRKELVVRLCQPDYGWQQVDRWRDRFPEIRLNDGTSNLAPLVKDCRLYISTYNATTYLESLPGNIPTVIFWNPELMEINDRAKPYFDELERAGIFHRTPESAASHINGIWNAIDAWWRSRESRKARERFVRQFAFSPPDKLARLARTLTEMALTS